MKEKKIVLLVVLGVSLAALITALVAGIVSGLMTIFDESSVSLRLSRDLVGGLLLGAAVLGILFISLYFFNKKNRHLANIILTAILAVYLLVTGVVLGKVSFGSYYTPQDYAYVTTYVSSVLSIVLPAAFITVSSMLLAKLKEKEAKQETEQSE